MLHQMRWFLIIVLLAAMTQEVVSGVSIQGKRELTWRQERGLTALLQKGNVVWQLNYRKEEGKPYFHPLSTVYGDVLTRLRPEDHPWHRALWFSWKMINDVNYWEENRETGLSHGLTEVVEANVTTNPDFSAVVELTLSYHPAEKEEVLSERCVITISAPDRWGHYRIDWFSCFRATRTEVLFHRTPPLGEKDGKSWGGYAGLSVRTALETMNWKISDSEGRVDAAIHGKQAKWVAMRGETTGEAAGITIFDHPANMRYPSPWYVAKGMPYFSPAVLFNKPYSLGKGAEFTLRYRVLVHSGEMDKALIEREMIRFHKTATYDTNAASRTLNATDRSAP